MSNPDTAQERSFLLAVSAEKLAYRYNNAVSAALHNCTLRIGKGEFYGLLGPNGAGKTTLMSMLCGLLVPDRGRITILGMDLRREAVKVKQVIGLVPQETALYERLTAGENLCFFGRLHGMEKTYLRWRIRQCLEIAGLVEQENRLVNSFSGGMKRRLNLAAGILHEPQILLLDEPTAGVDAQSRNCIQEQLAGLNRQGVTILLTTHSMEDAARMCSRIGIIDGGRLLDQGTVQELTLRHDCPDLEHLFLHLTGRGLRDSR
jgi:ABC-2 type transport system ATP-binding protein